MLKPMPSPRGTNFEKLYILQGRGAPSPQMAYDSAPNGPRTAAEGARYGAAVAKRLLGGRQTLAYDEAPERDVARGNADSVRQIAEWAQSNLSPQDIDELIAALSNSKDIGLDRRHAQDTRRPSRGMSAGASASFQEMFPDAARIKY